MAVARDAQGVEEQYRRIGDVHRGGRQALLPAFSQCMIMTQAFHFIFQRQLSTF
jgi:hypothetical protein